MLYEYFGERNIQCNSIIYQTQVLVDGVIVFYEKVYDIRIQYLKRRTICLFLFGESQTSGEVSMYHNKIFATYEILKALKLKKNLNMWGCIWEENLMLINRERGVRSFLNDKNYFMEI